MGRNQRDESLIIPQKFNEISQLGNATLDLTAANGSGTVTISNVAPAGVGTATISQWLIVRIGSTDYYIPMWT